MPRTVGNLPSCRPQHSALAGSAPSTPLWLEKGQVTASCLVRLPEDSEKWFRGRDRTASPTYKRRL